MRIGGVWHEVRVVVICVGWRDGDLVDGWCEEGGECGCVVMSGGGFAFGGCNGGSYGSGDSGVIGGWCGRSVHVGVGVVDGIVVIGGGSHVVGCGGGVGCDGVVGGGFGSGGLKSGGGGREVHGDDVVFVACVGLNGVALGVVRGVVRRN